MLYRSLLSESPTGLSVQIADGSEHSLLCGEPNKFFPTTTQQQTLLKYFVETSEPPILGKKTYGSRPLFAGVVHSSS